MADLSVFLPKACWPLLGQALKGTPEQRSVEGSVLFCDVAGFTPLTEALQVLGREGAEELTRLLNGYFTCMVGIAEEEGGDVLRFGGDAMAVLFAGKSRAAAAHVAAKMMAAMPDFAALPTRAGVFGLSMKIGAAHGVVYLGMLADGAGGCDYYAAGAPLDEAAEAEHRAVPGLVVCHPSFVESSADTLSLEPLADGFAKLLGGPRVTGHSGGTPPRPSPEQVAKAVPTYLADRSGKVRRGEHRGVAVLFVSLGGLWDASAPAEGHSRLQQSFKTLWATARRYGGIVNKLDLGDKGAKAILLFGTPYALEQKEEMAVRAAMELASSRDFPKGVRLAVGATSAHLFAGPIGSVARQEYTVMGDGINLAARLMQQAAPGQILCDLRCLRAASGAIQFKALPSITVKGKRHPVLVAEPVGESEAEHGGGAALFEREVLCERLCAFLDGTGEKPLALEGESGLGKTALLDWAMARA